MNATAPSAPVVYDAFISYSRKDAAFALRLQKALERYRPVIDGRQRARLRIFLDQSDLTGVDYFEAIERQLSQARKLIVVCSPDAAASPYVGDEIDRFVKHASAGAVVPVLWRGQPNNEVAPDSDQRAFPAALTRAMQMPLAVDYRRLVGDRARPDAADHQGAWTGLLANLLDQPRAEIEQREARRRRARLRLWATGITGVVAALSVLTAWALIEGERALAGRLAARAALPGGLEPADVARRALLAREAVQRLAALGEPTLDGETPLRAALAQTGRRLLALPAGARSFAFVPDATHLLVAEGGRLRALALDGGALRREVALAAPLRRIEVGADLRHVAALDDQGRLLLWSWPALQPLSDVPAVLTGGGLHCLAFDTRGRTLIALRLGGDAPRRAELLRWQPGTPALVGRAEVDLPAGAWIGAEDCLQARQGDSTGQAVLARLEAPPPESGDVDRTLALRWPLADLAWTFLPGQPAQAITVHARARHAMLDQNANLLAIDRDGQLLAGGGRGLAGRRLADEHFGPLALSGDGQWLLVARSAHDPYVPLLRSTHFEIVSTGTGHVGQALADQAGGGRFTPDGQRVATYSGRRVRLWDRRSGAELLRLATAADIVALHFDAASRHAAAVMGDGRVDLFAIGDPEAGGSRPAPHLTAALASPGRIASADDERLLVEPDGAAAGLPAVLDIDGWIGALQAAPDGRWLAVSVWPAAPLIRIRPATNPQVWLVQTGPVPQVRQRLASVRTVRFDAGARRLLWLAPDGTLGAIDLAAPAQVAWQVKTGLAGGADLAVSDDGSVVAGADESGLRLLAGSDGRELRRDGRPTRRVALSGDGLRLARVDADGRLGVERAADGGATATMQAGAVVGARELIFSPGGRRLLASGGTTFGTFLGTSHFAEEHLAVWDADTGRLIQRIPGQAGPGEDYQEAIGPKADEYRQLTDLVWNRHGREVAAQVFPSVLAYWTLPAEHVTSRIQAWRLGDDGLVEIFRADNRLQHGLQALDDGGTLWLKTLDGHRHALDLSGRRLPALACRWIEGGPSDAEWTAELGSRWRRPDRCPPR